jgi:hypothetical protein
VVSSDGFEDEEDSTSPLSFATLTVITDHGKPNQRASQYEGERLTEEESGPRTAATQGEG